MRYYPGYFVDVCEWGTYDADFGVVDEGADPNCAFEGVVWIVCKKRMANFIIGEKHGTGGGGTSSGCVAGSLACAPKGWLLYSVEVPLVVFM